MGKTVVKGAVTWQLQQCLLTSREKSLLSEPAALACSPLGGVNAAKMPSEPESNIISRSEDRSIPAFLPEKVAQFAEIAKKYAQDVVVRGL